MGTNSKGLFLVY